MLVQHELGTATDDFCGVAFSTMTKGIQQDDLERLVRFGIHRQCKLSSISTAPGHF